MVVPMEWQVLDVFWSMLWFALFFIWIWMLIMVFGDIFRSPDLSGWAKALWTIFIIVLPYLGVLVYLIARGHKMSEHARQAAGAQEAATREYIQSVSAPRTSGADEIAQLAALRDQDVITEEEFQQGKAKALG
jgi:ABC-type multidrug transport system fused ATPase/permease subunit